MDQFYKAIIAMKRILISIMVIIGTLSLSAQNLVKNPGFEEYFHLPDMKYYNEEKYIDSAFICKYWHRVRETTPDYYHTESSEPNFAIPDGHFGYQPVISGNAYLGLGPINLDGAFELISGELIQPLNPGEIYKISFKYRFAGSSCYWKLDKLEVLITQNIDRFKKFYLMPSTTDVMSPDIKANVNIVDTVNNDGDWHTLNGTYKAIGGEKFISLGIFYQDKMFYKAMNEYLDNFCSGNYNRISENKFNKKHKKLFIKPNQNYKPIPSVAMKLSYYFIDDVSVVNVNSMK